MIKARKKRLGGFTLLEILVVLGVTTMLTGIVLTYGSQGRNQTALYVEQAKLAQVLVRAKSLSVATYFKSAGEVPCGYGVNVDHATNSYELFSYKVANCFDIKDAGIVASDPTVDYRVIEKYTVAPGVRLEAREANSLSTAFFLPPNPDTYIWVKDVLGVSLDPGYVDLVAVGGSLTMTIQITAGGQVGY